MDRKAACAHFEDPSSNEKALEAEREYLRHEARADGGRAQSFLGTMQEAEHEAFAAAQRDHEHRWRLILTQRQLAECGKDE